MRVSPSVAARLLSAVLSLACAVLHSGLVVAAEPVEPTLCRWTANPPVVDGQGDDAAWKSAATAPPFALPWLGDKARPAEAETRLRFLWDRGYLYFLAEMEDHDLWAEIAEQDGKCWENDVFELFFKPSREHTGYYEFQVTPKGTRLDMFIPNGTGTCSTTTGRRGLSTGKRRLL